MENFYKKAKKILIDNREFLPPTVASTSVATVEAAVAAGAASFLQLTTARVKTAVNKAINFHIFFIFNAPIKSFHIYTILRKKSKYQS
jgi:uncharacterized protein with PQ loop repeat